MTKIKRFIHSMIAFAFAFVLAIGGIGIKSAKASIPTDATVFKGVLFDYLHEKGEIINRNSVIVFDTDVVDISNINNDPLYSCIASEFSGSNRPKFGYYDGLNFLKINNDGTTSSTSTGEVTLSERFGSSSNDLSIIISNDWDHLYPPISFIPPPYWIIIPPIIPLPPYEPDPVPMATQIVVYDFVNNQMIEY